MKLALNEIKAPQKRDRDSDNLQNLIESIREIGMIEPIIINERNEIISGRRRFFAAKELKMAKVEVVYFEKDEIDNKIAAIDSNLMVLPLGDIDHDEALSKRKKLYEEKYPESRKNFRGRSDEKPFTKEVSEIVGVTRRSVELALARAEKASAQVANARREGKISSTIVNELVRLPTGQQDKLLPIIGNMKVSEVKNVVDTALKRDMEYAMDKAERVENTFHPKPIAFAMYRLKKVLVEFSEQKFKIPADAITMLLDEAQEIVDLLTDFIQLNTPKARHILRRHAPQASV